jgi:hypothetical protein
MVNYKGNVRNLHNENSTIYPSNNGKTQIDLGMTESDLLSHLFRTKATQIQINFIEEEIEKLLQSTILNEQVEVKTLLQHNVELELIKVAIETCTHDIDTLNQNSQEIDASIASYEVRTSEQY